MSSNLRPRSFSSFHGDEAPKESMYSKASCKSDVNVIKCLKSDTVSESESSSFLSDVKKSSGEYYKKYEHDEIPVRDKSYEESKTSLNILRSTDSGKSLTNSDLEKLENKIYKNISKELQTDVSTVRSLESNITFLKATVQEIFDNFYANMRDFEIYKKRYDEILAKNRDDSIADMENFIREMFQHIMDSTINGARHEIEILDKETKDTSVAKAMGDASAHTNTAVSAERNTIKLLESLHSVVEAYKTENSCPDATIDDKTMKINGKTKKEDTVNIYLLGDAPCVQIKMYDRKLLSEFNIKSPERMRKESHVISADNLKNIIDKQSEMQEYTREIHDDDAIDREIPVKESFAKKNISLNEDFTHETVKEENKSFMSKICGYICKKLRKY